MKTKVTVDEREIRTEVLITLPTGKEISISIQDNEKNDMIMIHAEDSGHNLSIIPSAGNCIFVKTKQ